MSNLSIYNGVALAGAYLNDWHVTGGGAVTLLEWQSGAHPGSEADNYFGGALTEFGFTLGLTTGSVVPAGAILDSVLLKFIVKATTGGSTDQIIFSIGHGDQGAPFTIPNTALKTCTLETVGLFAWTPANLLTTAVGVRTYSLLNSVRGFTFQVEVTWREPTLTSVAPASGTMLGGTNVTLVGVGFSGGGLTAVTFDGVAATGLVVASDISATCVTPAGRVGAVDVVATISGTPYTLVAAYIYLVTPPRLTADGTLALPVIDAAAMADPTRATIALRDAFVALSRTMQEFAFLLSTAPTNVRWVANPFTSVNFTVESADGGVWTVDAADQLEFDYVRLGDILFMQIRLTATSTLAGKTYTSLYIQMPGGYRTQGGVLHFGHCILDEAGSGSEELALVEADGTDTGQPVDKLRIRRLPLGTNFTAGIANLLDLRIFIQFRIVPPPTAQ